MNNSISPISILVPIKNGEKYLNDFISTLSNSVRDIDEIVVINDGSTDNTKIILSQWEKFQNNLNVISTHGIGLVEALNLGIKECKNIWIARYDVDDSYESDRLEKQRLEISQENSAIFCDYSFISESNEKLGLITGSIYKDATSISLANSVRTPHPGVMYNKDAITAVGGYIHEDFPAEDLSLWLRLSKVGNLVSSPNLLFNYRLRKGSITNINRKKVLQKKSDVLNFYKLNSKSLKFCNENFINLVNDYEKYSYPMQRKILFLRDLLAANKLQQNYLLKNINLIKDFVSNQDSFRILSEINKLKLEQIQREKYRKSIR